MQGQAAQVGVRSGAQRNRFWLPGLRLWTKKEDVLGALERPGLQSHEAWERGRGGLVGGTFPSERALSDTNMAHKLRRNADPIWLHQHGLWEDMD